MLPLKSIRNSVKRSSPTLYAIVLIHVFLAFVCLGGLLLDNRTLMGVNVWLKPLKFSISGAIYIFTLGFLITRYPFSEKKKRWINGIVAWTLLLEIGIIVLQASRGVLSHYNINNPTDALLFSAMGILIGINVLIMFLFIIETLRLKLDVPKPIQWAIFFGWCIVFFGSWVGGQMIGQLGHNIGVPDGGPGLPLLNWSTIGGDLRIAHFFGLHGIQLVPLFAFVLVKKGNLSPKNQLRAVTIFALAYAFWIGFTFYQAKLGISLV